MSGTCSCHLHDLSPGKEIQRFHGIFPVDAALGLHQKFREKMIVLRFRKIRDAHMGDDAHADIGSMPEGIGIEAAVPENCV